MHGVNSGDEPACACSWHRRRRPSVDSGAAHEGRPLKAVQLIQSNSRHGSRDNMTVDLDWLALQPGEGVEEGKLAAAGEALSTDAPATPLAHQEGRLGLLGGALSEIEPASPREATAGGGSSFTAAAGSSRAASGEPEGRGGSRSLAERGEGVEGEQLVMQKHLVFNSPQARGVRGAGLL